ncbi:MAG: recombinase family protein [Clostridia bacterium]|nr:recombinase family protein [Clostridia bacterium]
MGYNVAAYLRLSKEDNENMESNSIINQRELIEQYIRSKSDLQLVDYYIDDGYSGTNFNRPGFRRLLQDMKNKKINCIIVKDLSRFARSHIEADMYFENIFPALNIRFISVIENIDSFENPDSMDNLIVPFKNLLNDAYAKDISKKVRSALLTKRLNGEFIGTSATYGYLKDPKDKHKLIIDKVASKYVIQIFDSAKKGKTASEIANELNKSDVLTPYTYKVKNDNIGVDKKWNAKMINVILQNRVYIGELIQGKKKVENYRTHKLVSTNKDEWIITENHHEPIISKEDFDNVQEIIKNNKCARSNKEKDLFYSFLKCADCGSAFTLRKVKNYEYYHCTSYVRNGSCTNHSIRKDKLVGLVIEELNKKFKRNKINVLTRDILLKNINSIIIFQNGEVTINFK